MSFDRDLMKDVKRAAYLQLGRYDQAVSDL